MVTKTIMILGGGVGGLVVANELSRKVGRRHRIVLVERSPKHLFSPSLLWVMAGLAPSRGDNQRPASHGTPWG